MSKISEIPVIFERAASLFIKNWDRESLLGDFAEMYHYLVKNKGKVKAKTWYSSIIIKLFFLFLKNKTRGRFAMLKNNLKASFRNIRKNMSFSVINVLGLAIGMICTIIIALWINFELSYDKFHKKVDNLNRVYLSMPTEGGMWYENPLPGGIAPHLKREYPEIINSTNYLTHNGKVSTNNKSFMCNQAFVHKDFFKMFSFPVKEGNPKKYLEDPKSCIIEKKTARKFFGNTNPIGKFLDGKYRIDGIIQVPENSSFQFDLLFSYERLPKHLKDWDSMCTRAFVELKKGTDLTSLEEKIYGLYMKYSKGYKQQKAGGENVDEIGLHLQPFKKYHLYTPGDGGGPIYYVYGFSVLAFFILLIGCINFSNLSTARASTRCKEIGMKKILGSSRGQLISQFLSESMILSLLALLLAMVGSFFVLPIINTWLATDLHLGINDQTPLMLLVVTLITGIMAGAYPAFYLSRITPSSSFKGLASPGGGRSREVTRKSLIILQFAMSMFFIIVTYIIYSQIDFILHKDPGFHNAGVLAIRSTRGMENKYEVVRQKLLENPQIHSVTRAETTFIGQQSSSSIQWEREAHPAEFTVDINEVDSEYFHLFDMKLLQGRFFQRDSIRDRKESFVLNRSAVEAIGINNPIGLKITFCPGGSMEREGIVIGVVENYHTESLHSKIRPKILTLGGSGRNWYVRFHKDFGKGSLQSVRGTISSLIPNALFSCAWLDDKLNGTYKSERIVGSLVGYITFVAVALSCIGLFSFASFMVARKKKEVGIKKVLGATVHGIALSFTFDFVKWVLLAAALASPLGWYTGNRLLGYFEYKIILNPLHCIIPGLLILTLAIIAVAYQSIKAGTVNPVKVLAD